MARKFKRPLVLSLLSTIVAMPVFCFVYSGYKWNLIDDDLYGQFGQLCRSASFWLIALLVTFFALLPDLMVATCENSFLLHELARVAKFERKGTLK